MQNGIQLEVISNQIGIQLYTADFLNALQTSCDDGIESCVQKYGKHAGFCLMPDTFPDALTHVSLMYYINGSKGNINSLYNNLIYF